MPRCFSASFVMARRALLYVLVFDVTRSVCHDIDGVYKARYPRVMFVTLMVRQLHGDEAQER